MMLRTLLIANRMRKDMDPGFGTGAPIAARMPNMAPSFLVLPTRLQWRCMLISVSSPMLLGCLKTLIDTAVSQSIIGVSSKRTYP